MYTNLYDETLSEVKGEFVHDFCCVCCEPATDKHHIVPRSHGGHTSPLVSLCRTCHDKVHKHRRLHFATGENVGGEEDELYILLTDSAMSIQHAVAQQGWIKLTDRMEVFAHYWNK